MPRFTTSNVLHMKVNMVTSMVDADEGKSNVKLPCLIADSAAFMKNVDLHDIAEKVFTLGDVINEIKDAATKQRLAVLQYEIIFREPSAESLKSGRFMFCFKKSMVLNLNLENQKFKKWSGSGGGDYLLKVRDL